MTVRDSRADEFVDDVGDGYGQELTWRLTGNENRGNEPDPQEFPHNQSRERRAASSAFSSSVPSGQYRYREALDIDTNVRRPGPLAIGTSALGCSSDCPER